MLLDSLKTGLNFLYFNLNLYYNRYIVVGVCFRPKCDITQYL